MPVKMETCLMYFSFDGEVNKYVFYSAANPLSI